MGVAGELKSNTLWEGRIELDGDVVVPAGVTLRMAPGVELAFAPKVRWSCSVFRSAPEGYPIEASSRELCDLVVFGRLEVEGTPTLPVLLGRPEGRWGGVTLLGNAAARLSHARVAGAEEFLMQSFDDSRLDLSDCTVSRAKIGVLAWGLSSVRIEDTRLEDLDCGLLCREGATVELTRVECRRAAQGVWAQHWGLTRLQDCHLEECSEFGAGAYDDSRLIMNGGCARACGRGVIAGGTSRVEVLGAKLHENQVGAQSIEFAQLELRDCLIASNREQGAKLSQSSTARVLGCRFKGNRLAGLYREDQAQVTASGNHFEEPLAHVLAGGA